VNFTTSSDFFSVTPYALFGCTEMISGIELSGNSKYGLERKCLTIRILLFGWRRICSWNHRVVSISNSCLDVQTMELYIFSLNNNLKDAKGQIYV
jgi:hypothetical protein